MRRALLLRHPCRRCVVGRWHVLIADDLHERVLRRSLWPTPGATFDSDRDLPLPGQAVDERRPGRAPKAARPTRAARFARSWSAPSSSRDALRVRAVHEVGARADVVVVAALLEGRHLQAAHEELQRVRDVATSTPSRPRARGRSETWISGLPTMRFESTSTAPGSASSARRVFGTPELPGSARRSAYWTSAATPPRRSARSARRRCAGPCGWLGRSFAYALHDSRLVFLRVAADRQGDEDVREVARHLRVVADGQQRVLDAGDRPDLVSRCARRSAASRGGWCPRARGC